MNKRARRSPNSDRKLARLIKLVDGTWVTHVASLALGVLKLALERRSDATVGPGHFG